MPTLGELVNETFKAAGLQQATGARIMFADGTSFTVHSDDNPALARQIDPTQPAPTVTAVQSAQGGM